jgi:hypothetical protein
MNNLFLYLLEVNMALVVFFIAYQLLFERDKNFITRRIYLMGSMLLTAIIPLVPAFREIPPVQDPLITIQLESITVFGSKTGVQPSSSFSWTQWLGILYVCVVFIGLLRLSIQLISVTTAVRKSEKRMFHGIPFLSSKRFHASSFFGYIFIDKDLTGEHSFHHILDHERIHSNQWHSVDRVLVEIFVMMNWFNPLAWMLRRAVIENLEYLADSAMLRKGTDPVKYQLSILNQYIGSASINNQFSSQIKNRINMLNKNYKLGSGWKLTILFPIVAIALIIVSCTDAEEVPATQIDEPEVVSEEIAGKIPDAVLADEPVFRVVEEMPTFQGGDPVVNFRKYIARNIQYPSEAAENGVTGKIFIQFVVTKEGKVIVPDLETFAKIEGKPLDEVVVITYRTMEKGEEVPEDKYIQMLKDEVIRVVSSSPAWEPGKQRGQAVNVAFTFPVNFAMQ